MYKRQLTTVLNPCKNIDSAAVVKALLEAYLPYYPDPDLLHSDGGSHFDNAIIKLLTKKREWEHTICTPYAKWAHGVAERKNSTAVGIMRTLCRQVGLIDTQWPSIIKLVQGAMNRKRRKSRGNMCPMQLTTGIQPRTAASMLTHDHKVLDVLDEESTRSVNEAARDLAKHMEDIYDMANVARREKSETNRRLSLIHI